MDWWYIFPMPDASSELFNWDASLLYEFWGYIMIGFILLVLGFNIWYYFFTLPDPSALKRYWLVYIFLGIFLISIALIFILSNTEKLAGEPQPLNFWRILQLIFWLTIDYLIITFLWWLLFLAFCYIPISKLQSRAMRRYPIYIKIKKNN